MPAGRPLEPAGNGGSRWMAAERDRRKAPGNRIRLTGQLVRPAHRYLHTERGAPPVTCANGLVASPGFSALPDV